MNFDTNSIVPNSSQESNKKSIKIATEQKSYPSTAAPSCNPPHIPLLATIADANETLVSDAQKTIFKDSENENRKRDMTVLIVAGSNAPAESWYQSIENQGMWNGSHTIRSFEVVRMIMCE